MEYFPRVLGNHGTKNRIGSAIRAGKAPHAFLIDGPRGSGKMTMALEIAAALNCEVRGGTLPCGRCNTCRRIYAGEYVDVKVLGLDGDRATVGVSQIKEFRRDMFLSATEAEFKVYVIKDAERMTPEAQNALLIVLEEPPKNVVILLLAAGCDRILTTIKSRAQYLPMARFTKGELREHLTAISQEAARLAVNDPERLGVVLTEADGILGRALELTDPVRSRALMEEREMTLGFIRSLGSRTGYASILRAVEALPTKRQELCSALESIMTAIRDVVAAKNASDAPTLFFANAEEAIRVGGELGQSYLLAIYDLLIHTHGELNKNAGVTALMTSLAAKVKLT